MAVEQRGERTLHHPICASHIRLPVGPAVPVGSPYCRREVGARRRMTSESEIQRWKEKKRKRQQGAKGKCECNLKSRLTHVQGRPGQHIYIFASLLQRWPSERKLSGRCLYLTVHQLDGARDTMTARERQRQREDGKSDLAELSWPCVRNECSSL